MREHLSIWTVYEHPRDYPDKFVARCWHVTKFGIVPTPSCVIANDLDGIRQAMIDMRLTRLDRFHEDNAVIVETWL